MLKRIGQPTFFILLASAAAIWQWSFIYALPPFASQFSLVLIVLVFTLFFFDFRWAVVVALTSGLWLDLVGFDFFGLYIISLFLTAVLTDRLLKGWLTNRSLYSFVLLILIASLAYDVLAAGLFYFSSADPGSFFLWRGAFWAGLAYRAAWSVTAALVMFSLAGAATRRLKPFFLANK